MSYIDLHQGDWFNQRLTDGGPVYTETNPDFFIVEPWNAVSSIVMMLPAFIWFIRIYPDLQDFRFLTFLLPLGFLGGLGSTLFHAFRAYPAFLILDILPSAILTLLLAIFFWYKAIKKWYFVLLIVIVSFGARMFLFRSGLPGHTAINISYAITGVFVAFPLIILLYKTKLYRYRDVIFAIVFFVLALFFREIDAREIVRWQMGTHFLWHILSAFGSYFVFSYVYYLTLSEKNAKAYSQG